MLGPGAGLFQAFRAIGGSQEQDPTGTAETIFGTEHQQLLHQHGRGRADSGRLLATTVPREDDARDFPGRRMIERGLPLTRHRRRVMRRSEVMLGRRDLDGAGTALLDFALVLWRPGRRRRDAEAVVLGTLAVGALNDRIAAETGEHHGRFEIVRHQPSGHAVEEREGVSVTEKPGLDTLVEDDFGLTMPIPGENHDEDPSLAGLSCGRVAMQPGIAEVDLCLTSE